MTLAEAALNSAVVTMIQIVFFGLVFGGISGIYHRVCNLRGRPHGPVGKTVVRWLCIVVVIACGLATVGHLNANPGNWALGGAFAIGVGYGVLRVFGTALVFHGVRRLIAGKVIAGEMVASARS